MYQELRSFTHRCILFGYYESYELQFQTGGMSDLRLNGRCVEHYTLVLYKFKRKDSTHGAVNIKSPEGSLGLFVLPRTGNWEVFYFSLADTWAGPRSNT